jgi:hypothetical protein
MSDHVVVARHGRQDQPIDALVEKVVDKRDLLGGVVAGIGDDRRITFARQRFGDAAEDRREHRIGDIRQQDADQVRSSGTQAGCDAVRLIAERLRQMHDPLSNIVGHQVALVRIERTGHR